MRIIEFNKVNKAFSGETILKNVSFQVDQGEFVSIIGKSGSGKSTILDILNGLVSNDSGEVLVASTISTVFQNYEKSLFPHLSAFQNVLIPFNRTNSQSKLQSEKYLNLVGLSDDMLKRPSQLSGGMNQRVAIARALAQEPQILLLDEPFGALDYNTRNTLLVEIQKIKHELNLTVIMVTHNIDEAIFLSSRILYLNDSLSTITNSFEIDIQYPRSIIDTMTSSTFNSYKKEILRAY